MNCSRSPRLFPCMRRGNKHEFELGLKSSCDVLQPWIRYQCEDYLCCSQIISSCSLERALKYLLFKTRHYFRSLSRLPLQKNLRNFVISQLWPSGYCRRRWKPPLPRSRTYPCFKVHFSSRSWLSCVSRRSICLKQKKLRLEILQRKTVSRVQLTHPRLYL